MTSLMATTCLILPSRVAAQAQVELIPSVSFFTVYDDNVFARTEGSAGQMLQLRPMFEGSYESPTVRLLGLYSFDMQRSNFATLNTFDARRHALADTRFRLSPFTTFSVATRYDRSETPGEISLDTGILGERRQAERVEVSPSFARRLTQFTSLTGGYNWTSENLIDGERGTMQTARAGLSRELSERTSASVSYVARSFVDDVDSQMSHALLFGWNKELSAGTRLSLFAGPKMTSYRGLTPEGGIGYSRTTTRIRLAADYWHGESMILGIQGPVRVDSVTSRAAWPLTRRFEVNLHAGVSDISTIDARTSTVYRGTLGASWSPGGLYIIGASYGLDYQNGTIRNPRVVDGELVPFDDRILRHVLRLSVTVAPRYSRSILPPDEAARAKGVSR